LMLKGVDVLTHHFTTITHHFTRNIHFRQVRKEALQTPAVIQRVTFLP
jgi:hypothetical protein